MDKLIDGLFEEYRIVQNKIDKIADFELKVRGWCITLESAIVISLLSGKIEMASPFYIIILILFVILVFQFLEQEQLETKKILSKRALIVEQYIDRLIVDRDESDLKRKTINSNVFKLLKGAPRTAISLRNSGRNRTIKSFKNMFIWKNHVFYYAQYLVVITMLLSVFLGTVKVNTSTIKNNNSVIKYQCVQSH